MFTWGEWAEALGAEIKSAQRAGDPDTGATYYRHWLAALERLVAAKGVADRAMLARYHDAWDRAADRTPHGTPIELRPQDFGPAHRRRVISRSHRLEGRVEIDVDQQRRVGLDALRDQVGRLVHGLGALGRDAERAGEADEIDRRIDSSMPT